MEASSALLIGCGKMGQALLRGWLSTNSFSSIDVVDPHEKPEGFDDARVAFYSTLSKAKKSYDIIVIAIKPQSITEASLKAYAEMKAPLFLSIAAGKTVESLRDVLGKDKRIVRAMPNLPASVGEAMSVLYAGKGVTKDDKDLADKTMSAAGLVEWIEDEELMHAVTALSGSGPAYLFQLIESMSKAGQKIGLNKKLATKLARQTVIGSAALAEAETDKTAEDLRVAVTSKGGTTEAALEILMDDKEGLDQLMIKALQNAVKRSEELS